MAKNRLKTNSKDKQTNKQTNKQTKINKQTKEKVKEKHVSIQNMTYLSMEKLLFVKCPKNENETDLIWLNYIINDWKKAK